MRTYCLLTLLFVLKGDCYMTNLALNKRVYVSSVKEDHYARYAVDGIVGEKYYAQVSNTNNGGWFVVDLGRPYQVKLVALHDKPKCLLDCGYQVDNLIVGFSNSFDPKVNKTLSEGYELCNDKIVRTRAIMFFECRTNVAYFRYVIVQLIDKGRRFFTIAEIEVLGTYFNYLGCFSSFPNNKALDRIVRFDKCIHNCFINSYYYATFQGTTCSCGNVVEHSSPLSECDVMCPGNVDYCGSSNRVSVYEITFPSHSIGHNYIGCSDDTNERLSSVVINNITVEKCRKFCVNHLQTSFEIQNGKECICGGVVRIYDRVEDTSCNKPCKGNPSQMCGGINATSIYSINVEWSQNFNHCKDGAGLDLDGICGNKQCEDGWTGEDCTLRDCSVNNGDCGVHVCRMTIGDFAECICKTGFDKSFWWDYCHDINECEAMPKVCNGIFSHCINTNGSYKCQSLETGCLYDYADNFSFDPSSEGDYGKINLALNKRTYLSSVFSHHYSRLAVDGNINRNIYALANNQNDDGWFVVDLGRPYQVEYIVFYQRSNCPSCNDRMVNFIVGVSNNFDPQINETLKRDYKLCAPHNGSLSLGCKVKLQCQDKEAYSRYVIIQQDVGKENLTIPELEVVGEYINYIGCFKTLTKNLTIGLNVSLKECIRYCDNMSHPYASLRETNCICGNETKHYAPLSECNVLCPGDVDYCGSSNRLSVYEVFPLKFLKSLKRKLIGCFLDEIRKRDLRPGMIGNNKMTLEKCQYYCAELNYLFFGVQSGDECYCGNNYGNYGEADYKTCNKACAGNLEQICGGGGRNSIYSIFTNARESNFFTYHHHCKDGAELDLDRTCGNMQCENGWTGEDCTVRDCSVNNGACGVHECQIINGKAGVFSECICKEGFDKSFWLDDCHDVDECEDETHKCNTTISTCINKEGSYDCKCFDEFIQYGSHICKESALKNLVPRSIHHFCIRSMQLLSLLITHCYSFSENDS